ncbi:MAG: hypothetical protein R3A48_13000 [Polyangiales bacterium]
MPLDEGAWATVIRPALDARCGGCHRDAARALRLSASPGAVEVIAELAAARALVTPGDPAASALRRRARGERHVTVIAPGDCVDAAITQWILGRAPAPCAPDAGAGVGLPRGLTPLGRARDAPSLDLSTPERALAAQLELLRRADYEALRETFLPAVWLRLTDRALDACRIAVLGRGERVTPAWSEPDDGGDARRVTVLGAAESAATFRRVEGRWRADALWCAPDRD